MKEAVFHVGGMTCSACSNAIIKQVGKLEGVDTCEVSLMTDECRVKFDEGQLTKDVVLECVEDCGFSCEFIKETSVTGVVGNETTVKAVLSVQGMTCSACSSAIVKQAGQLAGVVSVEVSLVTEECHVVFDKSMIDAATVQECIEDCGFGAGIMSVNETMASDLSSGKIKTTTLKLVGLNENSDVSELESFYNDTDTNGKIYDVDVINATANIQYNTSVIGIRKIIASLETFGYSVLLGNDLDNDDQLRMLSKVKEIQFWRLNLIKALSISIIVLSIYMFVPMFSPSLVKNKVFPYKQVTFIPGLFYRDIIGLILTSYIQFGVGLFFYRSAWSAYKHGSGTMDTLICISTTLAYTFSVYSILDNLGNNDEMQTLPNIQFGTSVMLVTFISFGKLLENKAKSKTSTALSKLINLYPSSCEIVEEIDGTELFTTLPSEFLEEGDNIVVKAGMKIPADGIITKGITEIDESFMTGEAILVTKTIGDQVIGGTVNGPGHFYFQATRVGNDTQLSQVIKTMKDAQLSKAPIQRYSDYLASIFVPVILLLSIITFTFWVVVCLKSQHIPSVLGENTHGKFYICLQIAISVVVVACPCALGLAAPTAIMVGTGTAAENGILIKGGDKIEMYDKVEVFLFDKTGTLTTGAMEVQKFVTASNILSDNKINAIAKVVSEMSDHPISKAIVRYCDKILEDNSDKIYRPKVLDSEIIVGKGISCTVEIDNEKHSVAIGNRKMMPQDSELFMETPDEIFSISYLLLDDKVVGKFTVADTVRSDAYETIQYLNNHGYECYMITGDISNSALHIASLVGIDFNNVFSEVTPGGKSDIVEQIKTKTGKYVAFVGDGINDSPALVLSDVGISISTGTDIAIEAADVVIIADEQNKLPAMKKVVYALDLSKKTFKRIKLNLFWALFYNTFMIPIAMGLLLPWGITLHPMSAAFAMAMSSVSVVFSSLSLKQWKPFPLDSQGLQREDKESFIKKCLRVFSFGSSRSRIEDLELQTNLV
ncbi:hypothetical protein TPHA_0C00270 [Tetrapisispora phaffii CBS 4417]|uniref:P-type Cu(+) transporter n=1 Tax=Tetrapisispora phaffii (strain ATCC 24235 / CBS 4417 / NBRC 1672 / NRRL Y-8282 / UCD 70-5) TaxID=1071381 RepID=G8BR08_TETPH|nr:hypothetical protein TPHA_0C00270 [Tetrapisispora phaffii CBS 4417]CCE62184.1 hypothetical protein TPHA_0C00270 [Tetrapisispora phaffii CBS 4417]